MGGKKLEVQIEEQEAVIAKLEAEKELTDTKAELSKSKSQVEAALKALKGE